MRLALDKKTMGLMGLLGLSWIVFGATGAWKAPKSADSKKNPIASTEDSLETGKALFKKLRCIKCHGEKGRGDGIKGKQLVKTPSDLTKYATSGVQTDGALFWKITNGRKPMPSYSRAATVKARWHLVNYIRFLAKQAKEEKASEEAEQTQPAPAPPQEKGQTAPK